jgi:hypothetical protein
MKRGFLVHVFMFVLIGSAFAQNDDEEEDVQTDNYPQPTKNVSKFFDDGRKSMANNALKFDVTGVIGGRLGLMYERKLSNALSVDGMAGVMVFKGFNFFNAVHLYTGSEIGSLIPVESNFFGVGLKWYPRKMAIDDGFYHGFQFMHYSVSLSEFDIYPPETHSLDMFRWYMGTQWLSGKNIAFDFGYWMSLGNYTLTIKSTNPIVPAETRNEIGGDIGIYFRTGVYF